MPQLNDAMRAAMIAVLLPAQPNLVVNGSFDANITGWVNDITDSYDTWEWGATGHLNVIGLVGDLHKGATPDNIVVTAGKVYKMRYTINIISGVLHHIGVRRAGGGAEIAEGAKSIAVSGAYNFSFAAPATESIAIYLRNDADFPGAFQLDNVEIIEILWKEQLNDLQRAWLEGNGATPGDLNDMWVEFLSAQTVSTGDFNDLAFTWLRSLSYTGSLNDMWLAFWVAGGTFP